MKKTVKKTAVAIIFSLIATTIYAQQLKTFYTNGKYGLKDSNGKVILEPKYSECKKDGGVFRVEINLDWGLINGKTGKEIIPPTYLAINEFSEGLAWVQLDRKGGYIDTTGKVVIPIAYDAYGIGNDFYEGTVVVAKDGKYGVIDKTGKTLVPFEYQSIGEFSEGLASVGLVDKFGFVDKSGKEIIPAKYDNVQRFENGFAKVSVAYKWGKIDKNGKEIIAVKYDDIQDFHNGLACVGIGGNWGYVDTTGKEIIPLQFEKTYWTDEVIIHARRPDGTIVKFDKKGNKIK